MINMIVTVVCNNLVGTQKCIQSAMRQDIPVNILAVDNGSTDGCGPWLRSLPRINVLSHPKRRNLHKIWNDAMVLGFQRMKLDHILIINNDIVLRPDTYHLLAADGGGFVTGVAVDSEEQFKQVDPKNRRPHPSFSCFLIRKEVWEKVGPFDESFNAYCGDTDYHLRMDRLGIDAYTIGVPFFHEFSGTLKHADNDLRDAVCREADDDRKHFRQKYGFDAGSPEYYKEFRHGHSGPDEKGKLHVRAVTA